MRYVGAWAYVASPVALVLGGCAVTDTVAREQAKSVVNSVVENRFPGVSVAPVTDCVIDAASASEIVFVASAANTGMTPETVQTVLEIATRPEAVSCIAESGLSLVN